MTTTDGGGQQLTADEKKALGDQLTRAWTLRSNQDQVLWRIFGAFWPTNAILLAALFRSGAQGPSRATGIISCAAGVFVAIAWLLVQHRALAHVKRLETVAERLEGRLGLDAAYALSALGNVPVGRGPKARLVMAACGVILGLSWLVGLIRFVTM